MDLREVEALLTELESRTDRLRALYEQYFLGFERLEPQVVRKDVERRMQALLRVPFRNTALRFRFTMLQQRYNTYQTYWMRTCRKIEDGTYKRQLQRLKAKDADILRNVEAAKEDMAIEIAEVDDLDVDFEEDDFESAAPTLPPPPQVLAEPAAAPVGASAEEKPIPKTGPKPTPSPADKKPWTKPPAGNTFDTRPTTPRMKAVRLPVKAKTDDTPTPKPAEVRPAAKPAEADATPAAPPVKSVPPKLPVRIANVPNEMHSRPTTPRMQAVRLPDKK